MFLKWWGPNGLKLTDMYVESVTSIETAGLELSSLALFFLLCRMYKYIKKIKIDIIATVTPLAILAISNNTFGLVAAIINKLCLRKI